MLKAQQTTHARYYQDIQRNLNAITNQIDKLPEEFMLMFQRLTQQLYLLEQNDDKRLQLEGTIHIIAHRTGEILPPMQLRGKIELTTLVRPASSE
jgi:hypothetical protein